MTRLVVAAAIVEHNGRFLVTRRQAGTHLAGCWEFPGGKCEPHESLEMCLQRELVEELGVGSIVGEQVLAQSHEYDDRQVELHFFRCVLTGPPEPRLGQALAWVTRTELTALELPPADAALVEMLTRS